MNPKTTIGLVVALLIAVVLVWWAQTTTPPEVSVEKPSGPIALFDPPLEDLTSFELQSADGAKFVFAQSENKWQMTAPVAGSAEYAKVNGDALKIKDLQCARVYRAGDKDRPGAAVSKLDQPLRSVRLTDKSGKTVVVKIGAAQAITQKTYLQKEGDETIYLADADLNKELRRALSDYRSKRITDFNQNDAVRVEMGGEKQYTLVKSDAKWTLEAPVKGRADAAKIGNLVRAASNITASSFVEDAPKSLRPYGLDAPRLRLAVTTETKKPKPQTQPATTQPTPPEFDIQTKIVRLAFGGTVGDKAFAMIDDGANSAVFEIASSVIDQVAPSLDDVRDKQIVVADTRRIQKIGLSAGAESVELVRDGGRWQIVEVSGRIDAEFAAVDDLLKALRELKATGFETTLSPVQGLEAPRASIQLAIEGQVEPVQLAVGGLTPSKTGAYLRNIGEGFIAVVKAETIDALMVRPIAFRNRELVRFDRSQVVKMELRRGADTCIVAQDGGVWRFTSPVAGRAEETAVNNILTDLSNLRGRRVVGTAAEAAAYGLDRPVVRAVLTVQPPPKMPPPPTTQSATTEPAGPVLPEPQPPVNHIVLVARQAGKTYAMMLGGGVVCEIDAKVLDDLEAELLETAVTSLDAAKVRSFSIAAEDRFVFEKKGSDWQLAGEPSFATDATKVTTALDALRDLRVQRYVKYAGANPAEFGLDQPPIVVTVQIEGAEPIVLHISAKGASEKDRYASVSTAPGRVFTIKAEDATKFAKGVLDFRKAG